MYLINTFSRRTIFIKEFFIDLIPDSIIRTRLPKIID